MQSLVLMRHLRAYGLLLGVRRLHSYFSRATRLVRKAECFRVSCRRAGRLLVAICSIQPHRYNATYRFHLMKVIAY